MENLLRTDFTKHYNLPAATVVDIYQETDEGYFEINDSTDYGVQISNVLNSGQAAYDNGRHRYLMGIISFDKFITSLPNTFQRGRKRCDLIVYTSKTNNYFLLNELKVSSKNHSKQLEESMVAIMGVPSIAAIVNQFSVKRCCFFNNKIQLAPAPINAVVAFNRVNSITRNGLQIEHTKMEALGFEYFKFYSGHRFDLA